MKEIVLGKHRGAAEVRGCGFQCKCFISCSFSGTHPGSVIFLDLPDPHPDPLVTCMDPAPDPSLFS
jgi:hypothetical protein